MMNRVWARGTFSGNYETTGKLCASDAIFVSQFGALEPYEIGAVHKKLANFAIGVDRFMTKNSLQSVPIIANRHSSLHLRLRAPWLRMISVEMASSDLFGEGVNSFVELETVGSLGFKRPVLVAQAYHVGRLSLHAKKLGMNPVVLGGLPNSFEPDSLQPWTRSKYAWGVRELVGAPYLKLQGLL